jgi:hypothetical protein
MIVLVESNFVLELAFRQEEVAHAERLMEFATQKRMKLVVPGCALFEPFETLVRRRKERNATRDKFRYEVLQLSRSEHFPNLAETSEAVAKIFVESVETEAAGLNNAISRILDCADVIPLTKEVMQHSIRVRDQFEFEPQDAVVFASIDLYLDERGKAESVFANKNSDDFAVPDVEERLGALNCKLLSTFANAADLIEHRRRAEDPRG